jgi:hypothetical protein
MGSHAAAAAGGGDSTAAAAADAHRRVSIFMSALLSSASFDRHTLQVGLLASSQGGQAFPDPAVFLLSLSVCSPDWFDVMYRLL